MIICFTCDQMKQTKWNFFANGKKKKYVSNSFSSPFINIDRKLKTNLKNLELYCPGQFNLFLNMVKALKSSKSKHYHLYFM